MTCAATAWHSAMAAHNIAAAGWVQFVKGVMIQLPCPIKVELLELQGTLPQHAGFVRVWLCAVKVGLPVVDGALDLIERKILSQCAIHQVWQLGVGGEPQRHELRRG